MNDTHIRHAIALTLSMWCDPQYRRFLRAKSPGPLDQEWFRWFVGAWSVARTIRAGQRESVRLHLDTVFRSELANGRGAEAVDDAAEFIRDQNWSAQQSTAARASLPVSLVSKVGFLLCPNDITPSDNLARRGLDRLRRKVGKALLEPWVAVIAVKIDFPAAALSSKAVQRKTLDNYLMLIGR